MSATQLIENLKQSAFKLIDLGVPVFRLKPGSKKPVAEHSWLAEKTLNKATVSAWFNEGIPYNVAAASGDGFVWFDFDVAKGGFQSRDELDLLGLLPATFTVRTRAGGEHRYYRGDSKNSVEKVAKGVDVRGEHGYVVAPGSVICKFNADYSPASIPQTYSVLIDAPIAEAPEALLKLNARAPEQAKRINTDAPIDHPAALHKAVHYLKNEAPKAIQGRSGDNTTIKIIMRLYDFGLSEETVFDQLLNHWNDTKAVPPWQPDDLKRKTLSAWRSRTTNANRDPIGFDQPALDFAVPVTEEQLNQIKTAEDRLQERLALAKATHWGALPMFRPMGETSSISSMIAAKPLIDGLLEEGSLCVLAGPPNAGKTALAIDMAHCIGGGFQWMGRKTVKTAAVYFAFEAARGIHNRSLAWRISRKETNSSGVYTIAGSVNLARDKKAAEAMIGACRLAEQELNQKVGVIFVDTLAAGMSGSNENAFEDMSAMVETMNRLGAAIQAAVVVLHHTGKDLDKGERGHSSLRGAADTMLLINDGWLRVTKQREMDYAQPISYRVIGVEIGKREDGVPVTAAVAELREGASEEAASDFIVPQPKNEFEMLAVEVLEDLSSESEQDAVDGGPAFITFKAWRSAFYQAYKKKYDVLQPDYKRWERAWVSLIEGKTVEKMPGTAGDFVRVTTDISYINQDFTK